MADLPILFSGPMIRALLDGRKTMTRRVLKPQPPDWIRLDDKPGYSCMTPPRHVEFRGTHPDEGYGAKFIPLKYTKGDRLWVRESHALVGSIDPGWLLYRASGYEAECARHGFDTPYPPESNVRWRPSIHMPRWASRLTLVVTSVKVERLQEISEADATREGIVPVARDSERNGASVRGWGLQGQGGLGFPTARKAFADLWETINGPGSWDVNPWIAAYSFAVHRCNVDQMEG